MISVEGLGKRYKLDHQRARNRNNSLREVISDKVRSVFGSPGKPENESQPAVDDFWALQNVNFKVEEGEIVGILGRNGAGKSTLLKILSRITEPTTGIVRLRGRVASLLEVGTGFHPELTGRENIFLNGAILGMSKSEIKRKFDDIVAFAGVERFLDTPVKRYSSGMYVRLAFAVAAHIETEILIIDEVLAVGDAQFQKKCLGKMEDVARSGRTVLFVSHNTNAVEELCSRAILLETGTVKADTADVRSLLTRYLVGDEAKRPSVWSNQNSSRNDHIHISRLAVTEKNGEPLVMPIRNDCEMWVEIEAQVLQPDQSLCIGYAIYTEDGIPLYWSYQTDGPEETWHRIKSGRIRCRARIQPRLLNEGIYRIEAISGLHFRQWFYEPGRTAPHVFFQIAGGLSDSPYWMSRRSGILAPVIHWDVQDVTERATPGVPWSTNSLVPVSGAIGNSA